MKARLTVFINGSDVGAMARPPQEVFMLRAGASPRLWSAFSRQIILPKEYPCERFNKPKLLFMELLPGMFNVCKFIRGKPGCSRQ
jgi:hypothetical protein